MRCQRLRAVDGFGAVPFEHVICICAAAVHCISISRKLIATAAKRQKICSSTKSGCAVYAAAAKTMAMAAAGSSSSIMRVYTDPTYSSDYVLKLFDMDGTSVAAQQRC